MLRFGSLELFNFYVFLNISTLNSVETDDWFQLQFPWNDSILFSRFCNVTFIFF